MGRWSRNSAPRHLKSSQNRHANQRFFSSPFELAGLGSMYVVSSCTHSHDLIERYCIAHFRKPRLYGTLSMRCRGYQLDSLQMDCWWNRATEDQAIDRCHRLGQDKPVYVKQYIITHTIEKRILRIQKRKTAIVNSALAGKGDSSESLENLMIIFEEDEEGE